MVIENTNNTLCSKINGAFKILSKLFVGLDLNDAINIYKIEKNGVYLDYIGNRILYGVRLESNSSIPLRLDDLKKTLERFRFSGKSTITYTIVKRPQNYSIFVHSFDYDIIEQISTNLGLTPMIGLEVANSLYDIYFINEKEITNNTMHDLNHELPNKFKLDLMFRQFKHRVKNASLKMLKNYDVYQGCQYHEKSEMDIDSVLRMKWNGVFQLVIDFNYNKASSYIGTLKDDSFFGDIDTYTTSRELLKDEKKPVLDYLAENAVLVNSFLIVDNEKAVSRLSSAFGIDFDENNSTAHKIVPKTLLLRRDSKFNAITEFDNLNKFFQTTIAKTTQNVPNKKNGVPDFCANDLNGNFANYAFANNNNPHCAIVGDTGTGKSVTLLEILSQVTGLNLENNTAKYLENDEVNIRYADVGFTGGRVVRKLRDIAPKKSEILSSKVSGFKFALFDFDKDENGKIEKEDIKFIVYFINTMLSLSSNEQEDMTLTALEEDTLIESITTICEDNLFADLKLYEVDKMGGFDFFIKEALEDGYNQNTNISELSSKYDKFKIPILKDLISYLKDKSNGKIVSTNMKAIYNSLELKMTTLNSFDSFSGYSNMDLTFKSLYYIDFNDIKDDQKAFTAIFWLLFKKWYSIDKRKALPILNEDGLPTPSYYIIEEAHNFFKIPAFADLFKVAAKEARKFHIYLIFVTQEPDDIPKPIFNSLATKIVLALPNSKGQVKKQLADKMDNMTQEEEEAFDKIKKHTFCIIHNEGFTTMRFNVDKDRVALYKPYDEEEEKKVS